MISGLRIAIQEEILEGQTEHRYEILSTLGQGGFGTVYRARFIGEGGFEKQVAIKILNDRVKDVADVAMRLRDEARMLGLLDHRAIVRVDRLVQVDKRWAVVMEYIHGVDLRQLLETGPIPPKHALEIVAEVASALAAAFDGTGHGGEALGLVHRDIKPENIYITPSGVIKVLDFGIARAEFRQREAYTSQVQYGSPNYMAPERFDQTLNEPDKSSIDVYALGAMLYEMVFGAHFGRTSPIQSRHETFLAERIDKLRHVRVSPKVVRLIERMLAYDEAERPSPREVERVALDLIATYGAEPLRYWAEARVPPLVLSGSAVPMEVGRYIAEDGAAVYSSNTSTIYFGPNVGTTTAPAQSTNRTGLYVAAAVGVLVLGSVLGGRFLGAQLEPRGADVVAAVAVDEPPVAPAVVAQPDDLPPAAPTVAPEPTLPAQPEVAASQPVERPAVPPAPEVAVQDTPAMAPSPLSPPPDDDRPHGLVRVSGDADRVVLVGVRNRYAADGRVPPGRYSIAADFGDGTLRALEAIELVEGQTLNVRCDGLLESCVVY